MRQPKTTLPAGSVQNGCLLCGRGILLTGNEGEALMISWRDDYLWAGLILLCINLVHFAQQKKLRDQNTILFFRMIYLGMLVCVLGIFMSAVQTQKIQAGRLPVLLAVTCVYAIYALLPYEVLCFIVTRLEYSAAQRRRVERIGMIPVAVAAGLVLLNIPFAFLASISDSGLIQIGVLYPYYVNGILLYYLFDCSYLWAYRKDLGGQNWKPLMEACAIMVIGVFSQYYLHIHMFFGLSAAVSVSILHLTLKNPHAYMNPGTQTFNAQYFEIWIAERLGAPRRGNLVAVEICHLDQIARLYDTGVSAGLAGKVAELLGELSPNPYVFQISPSRFVVWTTTEARANQLLQQSAERFAYPFLIDGISIRCSAVIAQISLERQLSSTGKVSAYLDFCLQQADCREDIHVIHDSPALQTRFDYEVEVERYLEEALEQDLFQVWYQPVYSVERKCFVALEALSRLQHPKLGWIPPELFIRLAGRAGLLTQIMPRQLRKICQFAQNHQEIFPTIQNIKINLSPQELADAGYCHELLAIIRESGLSPAWFQFEVTESTATQYTDDLKRCIQQLQRAGVKLCLDDFGSGYANLNTVLRLPFSVIKLDRSLLFGLCENQAVAAFYENIVSILKQMGFTVIAEGVETQEEVRCLSSWGVDQIQGYYFSKPQPQEQLIKLLQMQTSDQRS